MTASLGIGTRRLPSGRPDLLVAALAAGCRFWDAAATAFETGRSCDVARALAEALAQGMVSDPAEVRVSVRVGTASAAGGPSLSPAHLRQQVGLVAAALPCAADTLFLYNVEGHLDRHDRSAVLGQVEHAFAALEEACAAGQARRYGVCGWRALDDPHGEAPFSLGELAEIARRVGGEGHRFRAVQLPLSLIRFEPLAERVLSDQGVLREASDLGIDVYGSAPLGRGELVRLMRPALVDALREGASPVEAAVQLVRSVPGVAVVLLGPRTEEQVASLRALAEAPPIPRERVERVLRALAR